MTRDLPPGMVPLSGSMRYSSDDLGAYELALSHGQFSLTKRVHKDQPQDGLGLNLLIATAPIRIEEDVRLAPAITTEWLDISEEDLMGRGADCLHDFRYSFDHDVTPLPESPAALQDESYGTVDRMQLHFQRRSGAGYDLEASFEDEFGRAAHIRTQLPLFSIWVGSFSEAVSRFPVDWTAQHFDLNTLNTRWRRNGSGYHIWHTFHADFKETTND